MDFLIRKEAVDLELYVLACYELHTGEFAKFVRKGRGNAIVGYDSLASAKRGLAHTNTTYTSDNYDVYIVKSGSLEKVTE